MSYPEQKYDMEKDEEALQACLPVVENNRKVLAFFFVMRCGFRAMGASQAEISIGVRPKIAVRWVSLRHKI